jgi:hypothetical protein
MEDSTLAPTEVVQEVAAEEQITQAPQADMMAGVPDGTVLLTAQDVPNEAVVYDKADDGTIIGWHKEVVEA